MMNRIDVSYAKENYDGKLLLILFIRRIPQLLAACAAGALLVCGIYAGVSLSGNPQTYSVTSRYKVTYGTDPQTNYEYTYINKATWNTWVTTDYFLQLVSQQSEAVGMSAEYMASCLSADLETDLRMPTTKVTAESVDSAVRLNGAVQKAIIEFGKEQPEIELIELVDTAEPVRENRLPRIPQALILGGLLGLLAGAIVLVFRFFLEEAAYVPDTLEVRFGVPVAIRQDLAILKPVLAGREVTLVSFEAIEGLEEIGTELSEKCSVNVSVNAVDNVVGVDDITGMEMAKGPAVAVVRAGRDNGRGLNRLIKTAGLAGMDVQAMILVDVDEKLLKSYYGKRYYGKRWEA